MMSFTVLLQLNFYLQNLQKFIFTMLKSIIQTINNNTHATIVMVIKKGYAKIMTLVTATKKQQQ